MPTVYEFSRKFIPPEYSTRYNKYVSIGYDKEIGLRTELVPQEIEEAVHRGDFRLNDSYPPGEKIIALIAREIDNYSILAVATSELDDGGRPLVACRYFWIKNSDDKTFDSVATLLWWWHNNKQPRFKLTPESEWLKKGESLERNARFFPKENLKSYNKKNQYFLPQITSIPYLISVSQVISNKTDVWQWHALALQLKESYNIPLAWTWNVPSLQYPQNFTLISCESDSAYQRILSEIGKGKSISQIEERSSNLQINKQPLPTTKTLKSQALNPNNENIKKCLKDIASDKNLQDNFNNLVKYIPSNNWDWERIIDKTFRDNNTEASYKYKALLVILNPHNDPIEWLKDLRKTQDPSLQKLAVTIQAELFDICERNKNQQIFDRVYKIISQNLIYFLESKESNNYNHIKWLLVDSSKLLTDDLLRISWKKYTQDYAKNMFQDLLDNQYIKFLSKKNKLTSTDILEDNKDVFYYCMVQDLERWEELDKMNYKLTNYKPIAQLFQEINALNFAALLYQISQGFVPPEILERCTDIVEIIPLTKGKEKPNNNSQHFLKNLQLKLSK